MYTNAQVALQLAVQATEQGYNPLGKADQYLTWLNAQDTPKAQQPLQGGQPWDWDAARTILVNDRSVNVKQLREFDRLVQQGKLGQAEAFANGVTKIEQATPVSEGEGNMDDYMHNAAHVSPEDYAMFLAHLNAGRTSNAVAMYRTAMTQDPHNG
jgi:hypothetical protein